MIDGGTADLVAWTLTDHLNTVRDIAKYDPGTDTITVVNHLVYDAFGNVTSETDPTVDSLFLYTARPFDEDTGLQNNLNRWYDAAVGRWLSEDPIGYRGGMNLYEYVDDNPLTRSDPTGLVPISCECKYVRYGGFQGWTTYQSVTVDCTGLASNCCSAACTSDDPLVTASWTGQWNVVGAGPDNPAPSLCERVPWQSLTGLDCIACCIEQNSLPAKVQIAIAGTGVALRPPVPKGIVLPGQSTTTNYWVRQCIRGGASKNVTLGVRIAGRVGVAVLLIEGGYDCCLIGACIERCLTKS